jgi:hypothetical protein
MNDTAILLSPLRGIVQAVKTAAPVTCADILFCLNDLWHQLIKLTDCVRPPADIPSELLMSNTKDTKVHSRGGLGALFCGSL